MGPTLACGYSHAWIPSPSARASSSARTPTATAAADRTVGTAQDGKAAPLTDDLKLVLAALLDVTAGVRDRALLLLGFAGAFRRSELVALDVADVEIGREGAMVTLRRSKTDQGGAGARVGIPQGRHAASCPVRALVAWLGLLGAQEGPLFRAVDRSGWIRATRHSGIDVARIVKRTARLSARLDDDPDAAPRPLANATRPPLVDRAPLPPKCRSCTSRTPTWRRARPRPPDAGRAAPGRCVRRLDAMKGGIRPGTRVRAAIYAVMMLALFAFGMWMFKDVILAASLALISQAMVLATLHGDALERTGGPGSWSASGPAPGYAPTQGPVLPSWRDAGPS